MASNSTDDTSNLNIMAAAIEQMESSGAAAASTASAPTRQSNIMPQLIKKRRCKLVLPNLTQEMQQDLALSKGPGGAKAKPISISGRPEFADYQLKGIVTPHPNDVLCGRGGGSNNHPGNESFRELVNEVKVPYVNCPKREKPLIARRIVEAVRNQTPPGRFLSKDAKGVWNDIGDGKAREKTSQALREGAPIIRDMIGKPSPPPNNVAAVLKEAKKAERAEKEYGVKLKLPKKKRTQEKKSEDDMNPNLVTSQDMRNASPDLPTSEATAFIKRGMSMGNVGSSSDNISGTAPLPPIKKFRSSGDKTFSADNNVSRHCASLWSQQEQSLMQLQQRQFEVMRMQHQARSNMLGSFAPPHHSGPVEHPNGMTRFQQDSVPIEIVRRLLMGQIDPVELALQILRPEEAALVARLHSNVASARLPPPHGVFRGAAESSPAHHPLPLAPLVSDGSSTTSFGSQSNTHRAPVDQITAVPGGDDGSSVDSAKQQSKKRTLPKKKRKFVES